MPELEDLIFFNVAIDLDIIALVQFWCHYTVAIEISFNKENCFRWE